MSRWLAYFLRIVTIAAGYIAALVAAALFVNVMFFAGMGTESLATTHARAGIAFGTLLLASLYGHHTLVAAMVLVAWSEWSGRADWLLHALAGAGIAIFVYARRNGTAAGDHFDSRIAAVGIAAGIVGATVYWLISGRNAGKLMARYAVRSGGDVADEKPGTAD